MKLTENFCVYSIVFCIKTQYLVFRNQIRHYMLGYEENIEKRRRKEKNGTICANYRKNNKKRT